MKSIRPSYDALVEPVRARLGTDSQIEALLAPTIDPATLHLFLARWCGWGVHMTLPVESWTRRAGERCQTLGYPELGRALINHAKHEAGREQGQLEDLHWLVDDWNARRSPRLTADRFLRTPGTRSMRRYVDLHETVIAGVEPFAQIAIEYEIEGLSTTLGSRLVQQCQRVLGSEALRGLNFLQEQDAPGVGHTAFHHGQMVRLLQLHPQAAQILGITGTIALETYASFLGECLEQAARDRTGLPGFHLLNLAI